MRDAGRALRTLGSDAWFLASSPARMDGRDALTLAGVVAATAVVFNHDEAILRAARRNHDDPIYAPIKRLGYNLEPVGLMGNTLPWYFGTMVVGYAAGSRPLTVIPAEIIESHFLAGGVRNLSKLLLGRRRPFENQGPRAFEFDGGTSFPSGHTSVVFELATILSQHAQRWPVTVTTYALATTVAIQRVDSGNHWASDVVVPAITGTLIARTIVDRHRQGTSATVAATLGPVLTPGGGIGPGLTFRF